jgi:hypothetical protein
VIRFAFLSVLLGGPALAWWPGRMPGIIRKAATCLALAPVVLFFVFVLVALVRRPGPLLWPAGTGLVVFGTMIPAGAYAMWPREPPRKHRAVAGALFVVPVLGLFALSEAILSARGGTVVGKVTFKGQPVPAGKVTILSADGAVCTGDIRPDGRYAVYRVPPGAVRIAVATYPPPPPGPVPVPSAKYVPLPARYRDFATSALARVVTPGGQRQDLDLQP